MKFSYVVLVFLASVLIVSCGSDGGSNNNGKEECYSSNIKDMNGKCKSIMVKASPNDAKDNRMVKIYYSIIPASIKRNLTATPTPTPTTTATKEIGSAPTPVKNNDPIVFLEGGPGPSSTFGFDGQAKILASLFPNRDIIVMDYRGTGFSDPFPDCTPNNTLACLKKLDIKTSDYTTANIAYDLNKVLEKEKINKTILIGFSYGTRVATTMARDYPNKVSAMILDGFFTIEANGISQASESILDKLNDLAIKYDKAYPSDTLRDKLENISTEGLLDTLKALSELAYKDDGVTQAKTFLDKLSKNKAREIKTGYEGRFNSMIMSLAIIVHEEFAFVDKQKPYNFGFKTNVINALKPFQGGSPLDTTQLEEIKPLFPTILDDKEIQPLVSDIPTLILTGGLDLQTTKYWAVNAQKHLKNSRHFFFRESNHVVLGNDFANASIVVSKFLENYSNLSALDSLENKAFTQLK